MSEDILDVQYPTDNIEILALRAEIERLRNLITECADALETSGPIIRQSPLVRRAREATK